MHRSKIIAILLLIHLIQIGRTTSQVGRGVIYGASITVVLHTLPLSVRTPLTRHKIIEIIPILAITLRETECGVIFGVSITAALRIIVLIVGIPPTRVKITEIMPILVITSNIGDKPTIEVILEEGVVIIEVITVAVVATIIIIEGTLMVVPILIEVLTVIMG